MSKRVKRVVANLWLVFIIVGLWVIGNDHSTDGFVGFWAATLIIGLMQVLSGAKELRRRSEEAEHRANLDLAVYDAQRRIGFIDQLWKTLDEGDGRFVPTIEQSGRMYGDLIWEELHEADRRGAEVAKKRGLERLWSNT